MQDPMAFPGETSAILGSMDPTLQQQQKGSESMYDAAQQQDSAVHAAAYEAQQPPTPIQTESVTSASERAGSASNDSTVEESTTTVAHTTENAAGNDEETGTEEASSSSQKAATSTPRQRRERIRRIHLPVREGADELSEDEGDGSEWAQPPEDAQVPPGYDGPRRVRPEGEKVRPDGKIKPSYYYPTEGSSRGVPVFEPTLEEFKDFNTFINKIDNYGMRSGIVKVVPPKEWLGSLPSISQPLKDTIVKDAIEQNFMGSQGLFRQSNIASRRLYNVKQWKEMCDSDKYKTPNFFNAPEEEKEVPKPVKRPRKNTSSSTATPRATRGKRGRGRGGKRGGARTRKAASPAPSAVSEQTEATQAEQEREAAEEEPSQDVDLDKLQDPDEADKWEQDLKDQKKKEDLERAEAEGSESKNEELSAEAEESRGTSAQPLTAKFESGLGIDQISSQAEMQAVKAEEVPAQTSATPTVPAPQDYSSQLPSMPWQPTQFTWQPTQFPPAKPAQTMPFSPEFKPPISPSTANANPQELPTIASKVPAKRHIREENSDSWDKDWENFDYTSLPYGAKPSDFTVEECKQIEKTYWRRFTFGAPPMYGADGSGSLFDESVKDWNVAALDDLLMRVNPHMPMPGVNTPYLYFGMWRATFSWHVEDADLYSINYIHFGSPKFWYSIPQQSAERFERVMASYFGNDRKKCPEFLRHKSFLVSPSKLAKDGIPLNRVIQFPGDIILTYPYGYHSGFNLGFNCAESINFATENWLDIGRKARPCVCLPDTVRIDVDNWLEEARADAEKMRADPEYAARRKLEREIAVNIPQHEAKRKRELGSQYDERRARILAQLSLPPAPPVAPRQPSPEYQSTGSKSRPAKPQSVPAPMSAAVPLKPKKPSVTAQFAAAQARNANKAVVKGYYPCALCPEQLTEGLVKVAPPQDPNSKRAGKTLYAHSICVTFTPTTWCAPHPMTGEEMVFGYDAIEKERWALKCGLCTNKHGTKIQCTKSAKCFRAFHATCALKEDSGVLLDALVNGKSVLDPDQDDGEPTAGDGHLQLVVTCRYHNPAWVKAQQERKKTELADRVAALAIHSPIQIRTTTGVYSVYVMAHRKDQNAIEIMFGDGTRALCKHGAIVWPEESSRTPLYGAPKMQAQAQPAQQTAPMPQQPYANYQYPNQAAHPGYNAQQSYQAQTQQYQQATSPSYPTYAQGNYAGSSSAYGQAQQPQPTTYNGFTNGQAASYQKMYQAQQPPVNATPSADGGVASGPHATSATAAPAATPSYVPYARNEKMGAFTSGQPSYSAGQQQQSDH